MEGFYLLTALAIAMFVGSFLAGLIPLAFSMSEGRTRLFSTFGAGLLVGTALSVIIPEGVETLYFAQAGRQTVQSEQKNQIVYDIVKPHDVLNPAQRPFTVNKSINSINNFENSNVVKRMVKRQAALVPEVSEDGSEKYERKSTGAEVNNTGINRTIGYSLVIGFILMLIIDQISRSASSKGGGAERSRSKMTATIGLVVHAAADGIALGSASATNRTDIQFIVFIAVMLHKAPAAFGLVSFLLVENVERFRIRRHLIAFSVAAPLAALTTFYLIVALGNETLSADSATGILMLFSAGTFLYVATVHILPELVNSSTSSGYQLVNDAVGTDGGHMHCGSGGGAPLKLRELLAIIVGAICPTILAASHSHSH